MGNNYCPKEIVNMSRKILLWQEIISSYRKWIPFTGNLFSWREIISFDPKLYSLTENNFLWPDIISFKQKSYPLTENHFCVFEKRLFHFMGHDFLTKEINNLFWDSSSCYFLNWSRKAWFLPNISLETKDFLGTQFPGSPGISHPGACDQRSNLGGHYFR